jgi:hypothetical protein
MTGSIGCLFSFAGKRQQLGRASLARMAGFCALACLLMPVISAHADDITYGYDAIVRLLNGVYCGSTDAFLCPCSGWH